MLYNGFPATYQPYYQLPQQPQQVQIQAPQQQAQPQQPSTSILWVQGEAGARAYPVAPGASVLLMDSETSAFYIKTMDASGMPQPLRTFDYVERQHAASTPPMAQAQPQMDLSGYVTRDELEERLASLTPKKKGMSADA